MIAVALSPNARALIQAHRNAGRPTAADRERITSALRAAIGSTALPLETPVSNRMTSAGAHRRSATAFGVCVVGSVLLLARQPAATVGPATQLRNKPVLAAPSASAVTVSSEPVVASEAAEPTQRKIAPSARRRPTSKVPAPPALDPLAEEVLLLSSATSQLSSGQAGGALLALEEHQRLFSSGALSDERNAAKARALCALHRFSEGRAALALLASGSPLGARAQEDCDSSSLRANSPGSSRKAESN
jgi:hypothetical protein